MNQQLELENIVDGDGNPAGGSVAGTGIMIRWQDGPLGREPNRSDPNGAFVEGVISAAKQRLDWYEDVCGGKFACAQNKTAIGHLIGALKVLGERTVSRESRGVEGTHSV